jgi:hypothetical protein
MPASLGTAACGRVCGSPPGGIAALTRCQRDRTREDHRPRHCMQQDQAKLSVAKGTGKKRLEPAGTRSYRALGPRWACRGYTRDSGLLAITVPASLGTAACGRVCGLASEVIAALMRC